MLRRIGACLIALELCLAARLAIAQTEHRGQEDPIVIEWAAPEECPTASDVREQVFRDLGGPPEVGSDKRIVARAHVFRGETGVWHLELSSETRGNTGQRQLTASTCRGIANAAALIIALAFDPEAVEAARATREGSSQDTAPREAPKSATPPPVALSLSGPASPRVPPAGPRASRAPVSTPSGPRSFVGIGAAGDVGTLPGAALGFGGSAGLLVRGVRVALTATYWMLQRASLPDDAAMGGEFSFFSGAIEGCPFAELHGMEVGACVGIDLGRLHGGGFGVTNPGEDVEIWFAVRAGALVAWPISRRLALTSEFTALFPSTRPQWTLDNVGPVDRPGPVVGRAVLGAELRF